MDDETIDDISLISLIYLGCFAETYISKKKGSDKLYATKKIDLNYIDKIPSLKTYIENEILILKEIKHPNIIRLYEVKKREEYIYLIMEYCNGGTLFKVLNDYIEKNGMPFTEDIVKFLMKQILSGVEYLHKNKIIHRDLKLENILLKYNSDYEAKNSNIFSSQVKIIDFNISVKPRETKIKIISENHIEEDKNVADEKEDIIGLVILCYQMLLGKKPFDYGNYIKEVNFDNIKTTPNISSNAKSFLDCMLKKGLNVSALLKHDFLKENNIKNMNVNNNHNILNHSIKSKNNENFDKKPKLKYHIDTFSNTNYQNQPVLKKYAVGRRINTEQSNIIIKTCKKAYILMKGKLMTVKYAAEEIQKIIGNNWLVMISDLDCGEFDFSISQAKKGDYIMFSLDKKLFQVCRY